MIICLLIALFIITTAWVDATHIINGQYFKDHLPRVFQRASFFAVVMLIDYKISIAGVLFFAATFDACLNMFIGKPVFYLGSTAKWDRFFNKRKVLYITIKIALLIFSFILC